MPDTTRSRSSLKVGTPVLESIAATVSRGRFANTTDTGGRPGCGTCGGVSMENLIRGAEAAWPDLSSWLTCPSCSEGYTIPVRVVMASELSRRLEKTESTELLLWSLWQLGRAQLDAHAPEEAEAALREAQALSAQCHGSEHSATLAVANALGRSLTALGRHQEAADMLRHTWEVHRRLSGETHEDTLVSAWCLIRALLTADVFDSSCEAVVLVRTLLGTLQRSFGPRHVTTVDWATKLHGLLMEFNMEEEAHRLRRAALAPEWFKNGGVSAAQMLPVLRRRYGAETEEYLSTANSWANELSRDGRFEEAASIQEEVLSTLCRKSGSGSKIARFVAKNLAYSYEKLQRPLDAARLRKQAVCRAPRPKKLELCGGHLESELVETAESARLMMGATLECAVNEYASSLELRQKSDGRRAAALAWAKASEPLGGQTSPRDGEASI